MNRNYDKLTTTTLYHRGGKMRGRPNPRRGKGLLAWRSRQKRGAIMRPSTFEKIKRKAKRKGARNPARVAGKAYWQTAKAKYQEVKGH